MANRNLSAAKSAKNDEFYTQYADIQKEVNAYLEYEEWFKTINIAGIPLNEQELLNAIYSDPFVTRAKEVFSNSQNAAIQKWSAYVRGPAARQAFLATALGWVSKGSVDGYMAQHRNDRDIKELEAYFTSVLDWIESVFPETHDEMCGLKWGGLYERHHRTAYNAAAVARRVNELLADDAVTDKRGLFAYLLGGETEPKPLNVRVFKPAEARAAYRRQTDAATKKGVSNCPLCALGPAATSTRIWDFKDMDADHVTAWSKGGKTDAANCQMHCKTHNRAKGNR